MASGERQKIQAWDTAGSERFRTVISGYYRSAHGAMLAFDITRAAEEDTLVNLKYWVDELAKKAPTCPILLVATKGDLIEEEAETTAAGSLFVQLREYSQQVFAYIVTSAKQDRNVSKVFTSLAEKAVVVVEQARLAQSAQTEHVSLIGDTGRKGFSPSCC